MGDWLYFLAKKQKFTVNVVVGLLGNESSDSNRFTLVTPKPENGVRLQATLGNQNPTGLPVGAVSMGMMLTECTGNDINKKQEALAGIILVSAFSSVNTTSVTL